MSGFDGRVCVVTGAGNGIGRALSIGLARRGARLAISDIDDDGLAATRRLVEQLGADVHAAHLDVADRAAFAAYVDDVVGHFGAVHQVYNNAGIWLARSVLDAEFADFERVWETDVWGVIHGSKLFLPHLIASGDGHLINVSSVNGVLAVGETSAYCTAKFAVRGFTEALRQELFAAGHPVRVLTVLPGGVDTNIASSAIHEAAETAGELSERDRRVERFFNRVVLRLDPDKAAQMILRAVERDKARVLVGSDARVIDAVTRVSPRFASWCAARGVKWVWR